MDFSVWCAVETALALPRLSDFAFVESPDVPSDEFARDPDG